MCFTVDEEDLKLSLIPSSRYFFSCSKVRGKAKSLWNTGSAPNVAVQPLLEGVLLLFGRILLPGSLIAFASHGRLTELKLVC